MLLFNLLKVTLDVAADRSGGDQNLRTSFWPEDCVIMIMLST